MANNIMQASSALPSILINAQIPNTESTQYTVSALTAVKISSFTLANTTTSDITIAVSLVKSGNAAGVSNRVLPTYLLKAGDSMILSEAVGAFLGPGDVISAIAGSSGAITMVVTGVVFS